MKRIWLVVILLLLLWTAVGRADDGRRVTVTLKLLSTDKQITGQVLEYDDKTVVLQAKAKIISLTWDELDTSSVYQARKKILISTRGSERNLTAEDHFQLGVFLAMRNRHSAAVSEFRKAEARDPSIKPRVQQAWRDVRRAKERNKKKITKPIVDKSRRGPVEGVIAGEGKTRHGMNYMKFSEEQHRQAMKLYREFGENVRQTIATDLVLLETRHFLIWTDWPESTRNLIPDWAEQMYSEMCDEFGFPRSEPIWLGKCPIFCFKTKARFDKFAQTVDSYQESTKALGYTKTAGNGYVHVVMRWLGNEEVHRNKFATTLVHESTHAFMHCYGSSRSLPPWLSEGLADYIAEQVLGDRCVTGENAVAAAKYYVKLRKPINKLFQFKGGLPGEFYPISHSLVVFLINNNQDGFIRIINDIKSGSSLESALTKHFKGMTVKTLERDWRAAVRQTYLSKP